MRNSKANLSEIRGVELNNTQKSALRGGEDGELKCYYCVCLNCIGEWTTKATSAAKAKENEGTNCESGLATCGETDMENCWGSGGDQ